MGTLNLLKNWNLILWQWLLPVLLTAAALICGVQLGGKPLRRLPSVLRETYGSILRRGCSRKQRRIFASALAATMGTGNLVGTALAVMTGGAGALFWMWISALLGMVLVFAENLLGIRFRQKAADGTVTGGALGYLRYGLSSRIPAAFFAFCCMIAALGMGNLVQSSTISQTVQKYDISAPLCGIVTAVMIAVILCGGTARIGTASAWLMPLLCGLYLAGCGILLILHCRAIPAVLLRIFREAFGIRAAGCGISAGVFLHSMCIGLRRGVFSNEAGLGSSALLHMETDSDDPEMQGKWAAAEVFADTLICCTATALVILTAPHAPYLNMGDTAGLLLHAFTSGLGRYAGGFLVVCMVLFAFATMIGWYPCGAACCRYLFGHSAEGVFLCCYVVAAFAGTLGSPEWIWAFCDCCNGMMALPNLYGILRLSGLLREYR